MVMTVTAYHLTLPFIKYCFDNYFAVIHITRSSVYSVSFQLKSSPSNDECTVTQTKPKDLSSSGTRSYLLESRILAMPAATPTAAAALTPPIAASLIFLLSRSSLDSMLAR
mmetsp:Transcript_7140/g.12446  ORF Transcript_7140/g.12446 Transcript_7140/m.12446 type:complete len:111 (-) Transcript_7140:510-842(-)